MTWRSTCRQVHALGDLTNNVLPPDLVEHRVAGCHHSTLPLPPGFRAQDNDSAQTDEFTMKSPLSDITVFSGNE